MKKIFFPITALLIALITFSCEPSTKEIADELEAELIAEHDVAMEKMQHAQHTLTTLNKEKKEFMLDSNSHHAAHLDECDKSIIDLEAADKAMMVWMREYANLSKETRTDDEKIIFFKEELVKIRKVKEQIELSIKEGERFVRKFFIDKAEHDENMLKMNPETEVVEDSTKNKDVEV